MKNNFRSVLFVGLMLCLLASAVFASTPYRPVPDNRSLSEIFSSVKVEGRYEQTRVRLITTNNDAWYSRWKMIEDARDTIDCTYYIVDKDIFGQAFIGLLLKKARMGLKIRLMIDGRVYRMPYMSKMPDKIEDSPLFRMSKSSSIIQSANPCSPHSPISKRSWLQTMTK